MAQPEEERRKIRRKAESLKSQMNIDLAGGNRVSYPTVPAA